MILQLEQNSTIDTIQRIFSKEFPYIKLEFFSQAHAKGSPTSSRFLIPPAKKIGEIRSFKGDGVIEVIPEMKVFELEKSFDSDFGLFVQVFRKSGRIWLETTATDEWTLIRQNQEGKELSETTRSDDNEIPDYHEQE